MGLKLSLQDAKDRDWLEKRGVNVKAILKDNETKAILTLDRLPKKRLETSLPPRKKPKYNNTRVEYDGLKFDSKYELSCWIVLKQLEKEGKIKSLKRQIPVTFEHNGVKLLKTIPDFYFEIIVQEKVVPIWADAKNPVTAKLKPFRVAQKMFKAFFNAPLLVFMEGLDIEKVIAAHRVEIN